MAFDDEDYFHAVLWLMEAERRLSAADAAEPRDVTIYLDRRADVLDYLAYSLYEVSPEMRRRPATSRALAVLETLRPRRRLLEIRLVTVPTPKILQSSLQSAAKKANVGALKAALSGVASHC